MPVDPIVTKRFIEALSTHLEDHLAAWKSSLADAKRDMETTLNAMSERIPAQAKPLLPEDLMTMLLEDALPAPVEKIVERVVEKVVEKPVPMAQPAAPGAADWSVVRSSMESIEAARTQVDVLTRFLSQAQAHASRVALLVLRNDRLTGWKAAGYDASGGRDEGIKSIDLGAHDDPFAGEALTKERSMLAEPPEESSPLRRALGGRAPARTLLVPMVIRDRIAGLLCADELPGETGRLNEAALESLTFVTGLCVDLLAARKRIPSPTLTPTGGQITRFGRSAEVLGDAGATVRAMPAIDIAPPPAAHPSPATTPTGSRSVEDLAKGRRITDASEALRALEESAAARKKTEPEPRPAHPPAPVHAPAPHAAAPAHATAPRATPAVPAMDDLGLTTAIPVPSVAPAAAPPPPRPAAPAPPAGGDLTMAFEQMKSGPAPAVPPMPAPPREAPAPRPAPAPAPAPAAADALAAGGAQPMAPPAGFVPRNKARGDDQSRAIEDAKRLARLLVSEIKLYNEKKVDEGRANLDIYQRLKDDIERSRQVFEERTPEAIRKGNDFFHEELVRILADGRADALGSVG